MEILILIIGGLMASPIQYQNAYCVCYRDNFKGAYCESIKKDGLQGSCHK
jgi:hypothetical protein